MTAYYNENEPYAAQWLRNLISEGHIAPGDVDERDIRSVGPGELRDYTQCHFFAGIGGWSLALRLAGWPDDRPVWTGSCPCQPFSAAGKGEAADDERHLWPAWFPLIAKRRPAIVFGEQVEAAIGWGWLDAVFADLEEQGYACGATVLPACGVGAPHIRQRAWFVADAGSERHQPITGRMETQDRSARSNADRQPKRGGASSRVGHPNSAGLQERKRDGRIQREAMGSHEGQAAVSGSDAWDCDWLPCTDGKARPVEPGTFPLAHGIPGRVGRLRAYGNAIVPQVAAEFIAAASEAMTETALTGIIRNADG